MQETGSVRDRVKKLAHKKRGIGLRSQNISSPSNSSEEIGFLPAALICAVLLLSCVLFYVVNNVQASSSVKKPLADKSFNHITRNEASTVFGNFNDKLSNMQKDIDTWAHRTWLLALAHNESANINENYHPESGYIIFDKDWKINKKPETMELSPEALDELRDDVK